MPKHPDKLHDLETHQVQLLETLQHLEQERAENEKSIRELDDRIRRVRRAAADLEDKRSKGPVKPPATAEAIAEAVEGVIASNGALPDADLRIAAAERLAKDGFAKQGLALRLTHFLRRRKKALSAGAELPPEPQSPTNLFGMEE